MLERHLNRLTDSCRELGIAHKADAERISGWIAELMEANGLQDAYIRYTVTAGEGLLGLPAGDYVKPAEILFAKELPAANAALYETGRAMRLLSLPRNTPESSVRMKSLHYMNNILAKRELARYPEQAGGSAEGLMLTSAGDVAEGIVSNVFSSRRGVYIRRTWVRAFCRGLLGRWCWNWLPILALRPKKAVMIGMCLPKRMKYLRQALFRRLFRSRR